VALLGVATLGVAILGVTILGVEALGVVFLGVATLGVAFRGVATLGVAALGVTTLGVVAFRVLTFGVATFTGDLDDLFFWIFGVAAFLGVALALIFWGVAKRSGKPLNLVDFAALGLLVANISLIPVILGVTGPLRVCLNISFTPMSLGLLRVGDCWNSVFNLPSLGVFCCGRSRKRLRMSRR